MPASSFPMVKKPTRVVARRALATLLGLMGLAVVEARAVSISLPGKLEIQLPPVLEVKIGDEWRTPATRVAAWGTSDLVRRVPVGLQDMVAVAAGETQALALKSDGTVVGWTDASYRPNMAVPEGLQGVVAIAACYAYSEAVLQDGTVVHWGDAVNSRGGSPYAPPRGLTGVTKIAAAGAHSVALMNDGSVRSWGDAHFNQTNVPAGLAGVTAVAAGAAHSLALKSDGKVVAWGSNQSGEATVPRDLGWVIAIAAGSGFSLALQEDGVVRAWGVNGYDQVRVPADLTGVVQIAAAGNHCLALKSDGTVVAWGAGGQPYNSAPTGPDGSPLLGGVQGLVAGNNFNAAIVSSVEMDRSLPGESSTTNSPLLRLRNPGPNQVLGVRTSRSPVVEGSFTGDAPMDIMYPLESREFQVHYTPNFDVDSYTRLQILTHETQRVRDYTIFARFAKLGIIDAQGDAVSTTGATKVVAWGQKDYGVATPPADLTDAVSISAGGTFSAAVRGDGSMIYWGGYDIAPTYPGSPPDEPVNIRAIAAGTTFYLALTDEGTVVQRGGGDTALIPKGLSHVAAIAAGTQALALKQDGTVVGWGGNASAPLVNPPKGLKEVTAIATGDEGPSLAVKQDGTVVGWGLDEYGYGAGKPPKGLANVKAVATGRYHSLALKFDGTVVAWGFNDPDGRPDLPGLLDVPAGLGGVTSIATSLFHCAALKADGTMVCWGQGFNGSAVVPPRLSGVTAIATGLVHTLALTEGAGTFASTPVLQSRSHQLSIRNDGARLLENVLVVISGRDADEFQVDNKPSSTVGYNPAPFTLTFTPRRPGPAQAELKAHANTLDSGFVLPLTGTGAPPPFLITAAKAGTRGASFTFAPPRSDAVTGLMLQRLTFKNTTGWRLDGLRLSLSRLPAGISLYSSSDGAPGALEVLYTAPIPAGALVSFDLVYFDPLRRTAASLSPLIKVAPLEAPVPAPGPVDGKIIAPRSIRDTAAGPLLDWPTTRGKIYVVEYSNDQGKIWNSAVHRLTGNSTSLRWIDRGQPETPLKPLSKASRMYRVKELAN